SVGTVSSPELLIRWVVPLILPPFGVGPIRFDIKCLAPEDPVRQSLNEDRAKDVGHVRRGNGEEKPECLNCRRQNEKCDYNIRLNWGGRTRRRSSVDSPSSQSSGQSGQFIFALSPSDTTQSDALLSTQVLQPSGSLEGSTTQVTLTEPPLWNAELAVETSYPRGLHDIQEPSAVPHQPTLKSSVESRPRTTSQELSPSWLALSSQTTMPLPCSTVPSYSQLDSNDAYLAEDAGPVIGSFNVFDLSPVAIPRAIPFPPSSMDNLNGSPDQDVHENLEKHSPYSSPQNATIMYPSYDSRSPSNATEAISPQSDSPQLFTACLTPKLSSVLNGTTAATDDFFATIMNGPVSAENLSNEQNREPSTAIAGQSVVIPDYQAMVPNGISSPEKKWHAYLTSVTDNYGLDSGRPDLDLNKNDDHSAIDINYALDLISYQSTSSSSDLSKTQLLGPKQAGLDGTRYTYYSSPVPINIPRYLSPLPTTLVQTPINLMYFHHFLNHTAKMLVPHDCSHNAFVSVLPSMAIGDSNLLNLLLAYSASHRARYLEHPEPTTRIAHWVSDVFPTLRVALEDPHEKVTDSHLAAAIMLLSLKIISPSTFEVPIPWQSHLKLARDFFLARKKQLEYPGSPVGAFLSRWLGYLDIMGTLSCRHSEPPLLDYYSVLKTCCATGGHDEFCVDCFTGFTPRTGLFLMRLGQLVHRCDNERFDEAGTFNSLWTPSPQTIASAEELIADLETVSTHAHANVKHFQETGATHIITMDRAFRYAGLLHLYRRVLGMPSSSENVKGALAELIEALRPIRSWDSAEVGALFPIFTAGCEAQEPEQRMEIKERLEILDGSGMKQVSTQCPGIEFTLY
ncbi:hypothetical protein FE257_001380, partial [Aspergillus nanangensis]